MKTKKFLIQQGDVYYLTTGKLLEYDAKAAKDDDQRKGVDEVAKEFRRIHDLPHTWYKCVEVTDSAMIAVNTGPDR